ncbi:MAG: FkbM family methyltransferase [Phycisphaera sp.]|nr:FkbM family methyltransferase [Phycisphaera sp.]
MKIRNILELLGIRSSPKSYGHFVDTWTLPADGDVELARWKHPKEGDKRFGQEKVDALRTFLGPGDVAVDIGAHTGDTAVPMAVAVGEKGIVVALEPNPYVFSVLEANSRLNSGHGRIIPLPIAAVAESGPIEFTYSDSGFCNGGRHEGMSRWHHGHPFRLQVEGRHLPSVLADEHPDLIDRIRYLKIDAEGHDHAVLESMESIVKRVRPIIRAEINKHTSHDDRKYFFEYVESLGYDIHLHEDGVTPQGRRIGTADVMIERHFDIFCVPKSPPPAS